MRAALQVRLVLLREGGRPITSRLATHEGRAHKIALSPDCPPTFLSSGEDGEVGHVIFF